MPAASPASSMFHRRLALLLAVIILGIAALVGQLLRLSVAQGAQLREQAESRLITRDWIGTQRGRILDRKNRVLAENRPSFDITVDYRVISGEWALRQAAAAARRAHLTRWGKLSPEQKQRLIDEYIPLFQGHIDAMWARLAQASGADPARLEERRAQIVRQVDSRYSRLLTRRMERKLEDRLARGEEISPQTEEEILKGISQRIEEQKAPHIILPKVPDAVGFELMRLAEQTTDLAVPGPGGESAARTIPLLPGLAVVNAGDREYPLDTIAVDVDFSTLPPFLGREGRGAITVEGVAYHILGRMKPSAQAEDNARRRRRIDAEESFRQRVLTPQGMGLLSPLDRGEYTDDDPAGLGGIEASQEDQLRGLRGLKVVQLESGDTRIIDPQPGADVHLTLDAVLQARVQAAMSPEMGLAIAQPWQHEGQPENPTVPDGTHLNGAAVIIEIDSGDILALVSTPSVPRSILKDDGARFFQDPYNREVDLPWLNRAIARPYPPGSIAKALVLNGAVKFGKLNLASPISCTGHLFPGKPDQYRCWIYKAHGGQTHDGYFGHAPVAHEALMVSCNIFFFTLGQRLGPDGINQTFSMFGLGEPWNLGLGIEHAGGIGTAGDGRGISGFDAIQVGIGQGPIAWTPLHAADAYATIARGGRRIHARIIDDGRPPGVVDIGLDPAAVRETLLGLSESINERPGTGHHVTIAGVQYPNITAPGVQVWGKTGTAAAPPIAVGPDSPLYDLAIPDPDLRPGFRVLRRGDHSWFVVLVGRAGENRPLYAIAVMMEYAGSGGKVSGPIVNQLIYALKTEGYL
jgi:penicillin-binding protein 2